MEVILTPELERLIQRKLDSGQYESPQAVVESAVHRLEEEDAEFGWSSAELQAAVDVGWEQAERGEGMSATEARSELARLRSERRRA